MKGKFYPTRRWSEDFTDFARERVTSEMLDVPNSAFRSICPNYNILRSDRAKRQLWADIVRAIAYAESEFAFNDSYQEPGGKTDRVTGKPTRSEGLLSMSYSDRCEGFDWESDRRLISNFSSQKAWTARYERSIFNPFVNIACGMRKMNALAADRGGRSVQSFLGSYWSTLRTSNPKGYKKFMRELGKSESGKACGL